jgi:arylsulfatase A-like enzyme
LYEGGVRVPAFLIWPQEIAAGQQSDVAMATQDYLPTILDYLSLDYPDATRPIDGLNLRPILEQQQEKRGKAIGFQFAKKRSWVTDQYKLISTDRGESFELYDLLSDPGESQNIASAFPAKVEEMKQELNSWISSCEKSNKGLDY